MKKRKQTYFVVISDDEAEKQNIFTDGLPKEWEVFDYQEAINAAASKIYDEGCPAEIFEIFTSVVEKVPVMPITLKARIRETLITMDIRSLIPRYRYFTSDKIPVKCLIPNIRLTECEH